MHSRFAKTDCGGGLFRSLFKGSALKMRIPSIVRTKSESSMDGDWERHGFFRARPLQAVGVPWPPARPTRVAISPSTRRSDRLRCWGLCCRGCVIGMMSLVEATSMTRRTRMAPRLYRGHRARASQQPQTVKPITSEQVDQMGVKLTARVRANPIHESCSEVSCASQPAYRRIDGPDRSPACNR